MSTIKIYATPQRSAMKPELQISLSITHTSCLPDTILRDGLADADRPSPRLQGKSFNKLPRNRKISFRLLVDESGLLDNRLQASDLHNCAF
jgi:hypothetical protein